MNTTTETFALARRGLPLARATAAHATLRGAWLPAASRNRAAALLPPSPAAALPVPIEPEDSDDWRAEAMEWVPSDESQVQPTSSASPQAATPVTRASRHVDERVSSAAPAFMPPRPLAVTPAGPESPHSQPVAQRPEAPATALKPTFLTERMASPSGPAAADQVIPLAATTAAQPEAPLRLQDHPPEAHHNPPATVTPTQPAKPRAMPSVVAPVSHSPRPLTTAAQHAHPVVSQGIEPMQQPAPSRNTTAPSPAVAPAIRVAPIELTAPLPRTPAPAEPAPAGPPLLTQAQAMGVPSDTAADRRAATPVDMASLLAPPAPRGAELRIDRVSVTVQAPASATPAAAQATAASAAARASAPPARVFRNPWAGYHARRD